MNTELTTKQKLAKEIPVFDEDAMDSNEKGYWLELLPSMTEEHALRLLTIIETHNIKTAQVEDKYKKAITTLNSEHLIEWNNLEEQQAADGAGILKELTA
jgi:Cdc6-like AAA superfamily ATPase